MNPSLSLSPRNPDSKKKKNSSSSAGLDGVVVHEPDDVPQLRDPGQQRPRGRVELGGLGPDRAVGTLLERRHLFLQEGDLLEDLLGLPLAELGLDDLLVLSDDLKCLELFVGRLVVFLYESVRERKRKRRERGGGDRKSSNKK